MTFLLLYRKQIVYLLAILVLVGGTWYTVHRVLDHYYQKGRADADALWVQHYNQEVDARNAHIKQLEVLSAAQAKIIADEKVSLESRTNNDMHRYNQSPGKVQVRCPTAPVVGPTAPVVKPTAPVVDEGIVLNLDTNSIILPPDYISTWNKLNHEVKP